MRCVLRPCTHPQPLPLPPHSPAHTQPKGMTGTAATEVSEFDSIYKLPVAVVPTNRPVQRLDHPDVVYRLEKYKWRAVVEEVMKLSQSGRPVLVGTTSVEKSEVLSTMLTEAGIKHQVRACARGGGSRGYGEEGQGEKKWRVGEGFLWSWVAGRQWPVLVGTRVETSEAPSTAQLNIRHMHLAAHHRPGLRLLSRS